MLIIVNISQTSVDLKSRNKHFNAYSDVDTDIDAIMTAIYS